MYNNKTKENEQIEKRSFYSNKKLVENRGIERNSNLFGMNTRDDDVFKNNNKFEKKNIEINQFNKIDSDLQLGLPMRQISDRKNNNRSDNSNNLLSNRDFGIFNNMNPNFLENRNFEIKPKKLEKKFVNKEKENKLVNNILNSTLNEFSFNIFNSSNKLSSNELLITIGTINIISLIATIYLISDKENSNSFNNYFNKLKSDDIFNFVDNINKSLLQEKEINFINILLLSNKFQINSESKKKINSLCLFDNIETLLPEKESDHYNKIINDKFNTNKNHITPTLIYKSDLVMTNIIHFRTNWLNPFRIENTSVKVFYGEKKRKLIPMMKIYNSDILFYKKGNDVLFEIECHNNLNIGFYSSEDKNMINWNNAYNMIKKFKKIKINKLTIPKFKNHCKFKLNNVFNDIGLNFMNEIETNESIYNHKFKLSNTNHQILFEIFEGSSYDNLQINNSNTKDYINSISLNSPFTYYVRDTKSNLIILIGIFR
jgi:serine protease inhibitor